MFALYRSVESGQSQDTNINSKRIRGFSVPDHRKGIVFLREVKRDILGYFLRLMQSEGAYAAMSFSGKNVVMLNDATGIQYILQQNADNYHKSHFYDVLRPLLGNSIIMSEDEEWIKQRQITAPAFSHGRLSEMAKIMVRTLGETLERWNANIDADVPIDVNYESMSLTLNIMLRTLFNENCELIINQLQNAITVLAREAEERIWFPFKLPQAIIYRLPKYRRELTFLNDIVNSIVSQRRKADTMPDDLLTRLLMGYDDLPEARRHLRDQVMTFLLAGHESTASGLTWSLYQLCRYPKVFETMANEVDQVLQGRLPTLEDIRSLPYTRQVFDEVLRTYPVVWTISRAAQKDDCVPLDDGSSLTIPKDTTIMLSPYATHRRELYWENPESFDPDHFNEASSSCRPKFAYFPFGAGPRLCLGFRFAQFESLLSLIMIAQRFQISLVPGQDIRPVPSINLRPNGPILIRFKRRIMRQEHDMPKQELDSVKCPYAHKEAV